MTEDITRIVEALVQRYGTFRVVASPYILVSLLSGLGLLRNAQTAYTIGVCAIVFTSFVLATAFGLALRLERNARRGRERIILRLSETVSEVQGDPYRFVSWDETTLVGRRGDTTIDQYVRIEVSGDQPLRVLWRGTQKTSGVVSSAERRKVTVRMASFNEENGERRIGADHDIEYFWREDVLLAYLYFSEPILPGSIVLLYTRWVWPEFYADLVDGGRDVVEWVRKRPVSIDHIKLRMIFDRSAGITRPLSVRPRQGSPSPRQERRGDGSIEVTVEYTGPQITERVGFFLDNAHN